MILTSRKISYTKSQASHPFRRWIGFRFNGEDNWLHTASSFSSLISCYGYYLGIALNCLFVENLVVVPERL